MSNEILEHFGVKGMRWGVHKQKLGASVRRGLAIVKSILGSPAAQQSLRSMHSNQLNRRRTEAILNTKGQTRAREVTEARRKDRESLENRLEKVRQQSDAAESRRRITEMDNRS